MRGATPFACFSPVYRTNCTLTVAMQCSCQSPNQSKLCFLNVLCLSAQFCIWIQQRMWKAIKELILLHQRAAQTNLHLKTHNTTTLPIPANMEVKSWQDIHPEQQHLVMKSHYYIITSFTGWQHANMFYPHLKINIHLIKETYSY